MAAARDMAEHVVAHRQLETTLAQADINEWTIAVEAWEIDSSFPNPFEAAVSGMSVIQFVLILFSLLISIS